MWQCWQPQIWKYQPQVAIKLGQTKRSGWQYWNKLFKHKETKIQLFDFNFKGLGYDDLLFSSWIFTDFVQILDRSGPLKVCTLCYWNIRSEPSDLKSMIEICWENSAKNMYNLRGTEYPGTPDVYIITLFFFCESTSDQCHSHDLYQIITK